MQPTSAPPMRNILVVDDSAFEQRMLMDLLSEQPYRISVAFNGLQGYQLALANQPDLILLDVRMPGMNGLEVLRRVREIDREIGVIMVTAVNEEETGRQALALGAFDYIVKPLDLAYLEKSLWYKITTMLL